MSELLLKVDGRRPLEERELLSRWGCDLQNQRMVGRFKRKLWKLRKGRHPSGALLACIRVDRYIRLYPEASVIEVERTLAHWEADGLRV